MIWTRTGVYSRTGVGDTFFYCGFQPKALIIWTTEDDESYGGSPADLAVGFAVGAGSTHEISTRVHIQQGSVTYSLENENSIAHGTSSNGHVISFDQCGFTLHFTSAGTSSFCWMAVGGPDLQANWGAFTMPASTLSDIPVTGVGFQPDFVLTMMGAASFMNSGYAIGMASSPTDQAASMFHLSGSQNTTRFEQGALSTFFQASSDKYKCALKTFDADGFTVSVSEQQTVDHQIFFLALKSPSTLFKVGTDTQRTSAGTKATTGVGFAPGAALFAGTKDTAASSTSDPTTPVWLTFGGAADGKSAVTWVGADDGTDEGTRQVSGKVISNSDPAADTTNAEASLSTFDADGFTLDWTTADATARRFVYGVWEANTADFTCEPTNVGQIYRRSPY